MPDTGHKSIEEMTVEEMDQILEQQMSAPETPEPEPAETEVTETPETPPPAETPDPEKEVQTDTEAPPQEQSIIQRYNTLRSKIGTQGNELGQLRKENADLKANYEQMALRIKAYEQNRKPFEPHYNQLNKGQQQNVTGINYDDLDITDQTQVKNLVAAIKQQAVNEVKSEFENERKKETAVNQLVSEIVKFQDKHPEYRTKDHVSAIDRIGQSHPEYHKFDEITQLLEFGMTNGVNNLEAAFLLLQQETGALEQRIKGAKKEGAEETIKAINKAGEAVKTIGDLKGGEKTTAKSIKEVRSKSELEKIMSTATEKDIDRMLMETGMFN